MTAQRTRISPLWLILCLLIGNTGLLFNTAQAAPIAHIESSDGVVIAEREGQPSHALGRGSLLEKGEIITTQNGSHALIVFNDQTQLAVRPNSRVQLTDFAFREQAPQEDSFVIGLLKGGLRQVTGFISRNKSAYRLQVQSATIGIRGTDFTARLCDGLDCNIEQSAAQREQSKTAASSGTIGKAVWVQGQITAKSGEGTLRTLTMASPIFQGDVLSSDANGAAGFVMLDNTRLVLPKNSQISLTEYHFVASKSEEGRQLIDVVKGGLRVVTGLLGKLHSDRVQYRAAGATIGIRGTAFDIVCASAAHEMAECKGNTLNVAMRSGEISLSKDNTSIIVGAGQFAAITPGAIPQLQPQPPVPLLEPQLPKPEDIKVDPIKLFGLESANVEKGLYVSVNAGQVVLANAGGEISLSRGEAGFTGAVQIPVHLPAVPGFMDRDPVLSHYTLTSALSCNQ